MNHRRLFKLLAAFLVMLIADHVAFAQQARIHHVTRSNSRVYVSAASEMLLYSTLGQIGKGHLLTILASIKQGEEELAATMSLGEGSEEALKEELEQAPLPTEFALKPNYPNPFNPQTTIRYGLPEASYVKLVVYDVLGRQVRVLVDGAREAGTHEVTFDASSLPSGVYVYRIEAGPYAATRTMLLMK